MNCHPFSPILFAAELYRCVKEKETWNKEGKNEGKCHCRGFPHAAQHLAFAQDVCRLCGHCGRPGCSRVCGVRSRGATIGGGTCLDRGVCPGDVYGVRARQEGPGDCRGAHVRKCHRERRDRGVRRHRAHQCPGSRAGAAADRGAAELERRHRGGRHADEYGHHRGRG